MSDGEHPELSVGFAIDTGGSFDALTHLAALMDSTEAKIVREAKAIEQATGSMLNLGGATASINAFASTTSAAFNKAEQAAERMTARLAEQTATFGMTRAAAAAWRAEQAGASAAAEELRQAEAALNAVRDQAAAKTAAEAAAARDAAAEHSRLAATVQGSHDAQIADATAAERLRESTDSVYAATKRVNAQIAESTRLYHSGATAPAEYARQQAVLNARLTEEVGALGSSVRGHQAHASASGLSRNASMELTHVLKASAEQMAAGAPPLTILTTHLGQLGQIASMTEGGVRGLAKAFVGMVAPFAAVLAPIAAVAGVAFGAFKQFQGTVKDSGELTRYRDSLGLTHAELMQLGDGVDEAGGKVKKLGEVTVTAGDVMAGLWKTIKDGAGHGDAFDGFKDGALKAFAWVLEAWDKTSAGITAGIYGTVNASKIIWRNFASSIGDVFYQAVNVAIAAMNKLVKAGTDILNGFVHGANKIPGVNIGDLAAPQMAEVSNPYAGKAGQAAEAAAAKQIGDGYTKAYADARKANASFWKQVGANAIQHHKDTVKEQADALKANRTPTAPKVDHNTLNAEAVEAQIRNLYKLADAYAVSGAAALIAEAREKAESKAIKSRADVDAAVAQQVRLAIAQRVADAAKSTATMNDQAAAQEKVNAEVVAGLIPAAQAAQALQQRLALLPLLAAQEAVRTTGDTIGYAKATAALAALTAAQERDNKAKRDAQFIAAQAGAGDEMARLQLETKLIGASTEARVHDLAVLKAEQEAAQRSYDPAQTAEYVKAQVAIADQAQANANASAQLGEQFRLTAQLADSAAESMSKAFGSVGDAIGSAIKILGEYAEKQDAIDRAVLAGTKSQADADKESADLRINNLIGLTDAAKNMFAEHSAGYEAMAAAEKALAAWRAIQAVRDVAAGAAKMFASLGPFGFAAVAAMVAVMAGFGISGGGSSSVKPPVSWRPPEGGRHRDGAGIVRCEVRQHRAQPRPGGEEYGR